ncbi:hypothetical protein Tsubulata_040852 [Turnera subulata]|uniref:Uncharacterized protein n=1 Tax=Turnera subulata TaxID=218843 RepID=A0A9Q0JP56_9ROSI|nr:hypothetical protein Tsubulata_040852 [Turnera subulata]
MSQPDDSSAFPSSSSAFDGAGSSASHVPDESEYHRFPHPEREHFPHPERDHYPYPGREYFPYPGRERERNGTFFRGNVFGFDEASSVSDDSWSCIIVVEELNATKPGLMMYGFYESPPLDVVNTWSKARNLYVPADSYQDSAYFLNKGSQINISYDVNSPGSSIYLVIAEGYEGLDQWVQDPSYPNTTLSWNVRLNITVRALLYNTTESYYKCTFSHSKCRLGILFPTGNAVLLTSPKPGNGSRDDYWNVKLSYGPRWATYIVGIGVEYGALYVNLLSAVAGMTVLILAVFNSFKKFRHNPGQGTMVHPDGVASQNAPLLSQKDDDLSSLGSSYGSVSDDEKAYDDFLAAGSLERKSARDTENDSSTRRLCAICFDAPRDCFFLPCGHCDQRGCWNLPYMSEEY